MRDLNVTSSLYGTVDGHNLVPKMAADVYVICFGDDKTNSKLTNTFEN